MFVFTQMTKLETETNTSLTMAADNQQKLDLEAAQVEPEHESEPEFVPKLEPQPDHKSELELESDGQTNLDVPQLEEQELWATPEQFKQEPIRSDPKQPQLEQQLPKTIPELSQQPEQTQPKQHDLKEPQPQPSESNFKDQQPQVQALPKEPQAKSAKHVPPWRSYNGPKLYVKPVSRNSNQQIINKAVAKALEGAANANTLSKIQETIKTHLRTCNHFLILFRNYQFKGIYDYNEKACTITKLDGIGPKTICIENIVRFFKFDSTKRQFTEVETKQIGPTIIAISIATFSSK